MVRDPYAWWWGRGEAVRPLPISIMAIIIMNNPIQIESLKGEELNAVSFVMDYVEFHFNGPVIRALTNPKIETETKQYQFPKQGSRDALCSFIGKAIQSVIIEEGVSLTLVFLKNERILIPLDDDSYIGPEAMHWCPQDSPMQVW